MDKPIIFQNHFLLKHRGQDERTIKPSFLVLQTATPVVQDITFRGLDDDDDNDNVDLGEEDADDIDAGSQSEESPSEAFEQLR